MVAAVGMDFTGGSVEISPVNPVLVELHMADSAVLPTSS
jgi:hypothetical protein